VAKNARDFSDLENLSRCAGFLERSLGLRAPWRNVSAFEMTLPLPSALSGSPARGAPELPDASRSTTGAAAAASSAAMELRAPAAQAPTNEDLVPRLVRGDRNAVDEAYRAHHAAIRGLARRLLGDAAAAEDIVHETFVTLPRAIRKYRGESSFRSFLLGVAVNHSRRHVRSVMRRRRAMERLADRDAVGPSSFDGHAEVARRQLADRLTLALDQLSFDQREAFVLCEVEQRTSVEVAEILGIPEGTIRTRVFHAKRKLRTVLEGMAP
jgi:RNA polymerase sigma-70 factor (ECF subfamily)